MDKIFTIDRSNPERMTVLCQGNLVGVIISSSIIGGPTPMVHLRLENQIDLTTPMRLLEVVP